MDDHRFADPLTDTALDRDLEAALAVDPSPELVARVRMRVQRERDASWSPLQSGMGAAAAAAIVVVVAVVMGMSRANRSQMAQDSSPALRRGPVPVAQDLGPAPEDVQVAQAVPVAQDSSPAPNTAPRKAVAPSTRRGAPRNEPEVIIAADEARALRRLFADVRNGLIDLSSLQEGAPVTAALQPPSDIAFPPITFESIAPVTAEEGERQ